MENFIGVGTGRTYADFQRQIPEPVKPLLINYEHIAFHLMKK